jgi:hypothetical protein
MVFLHQRERYLAAMALLLSFALHLRAAADEPAAANDPHEGARQAVARFMKAVNEGDGEVLRDAIFCDFNVTARKQGVIAIVDCIVSQRALEQAMAEQWGAESIAAMAKRTTFSEADIASVASARVDERETKDKVLILPPPQSPIVVRPCSDGKWRVVLHMVNSLDDSTSIEHAADRPPRRLPEEGSRKQIERFRGIALTLRRTAKMVKDGEYSSFEVASAALERALHNAMVRPPAYDEAQDGPEKEVPAK